MNPLTNRQVNLILRHEVKSQVAAIDMRLDGIYGDHSAKGRLHSGATVRIAIAAMGDMVRDSLARLAVRVLSISSDVEAHAALAAAITDLLEFCRERVMRVAQMASGRMPNDPLPSVEAAAFELFGELESDIETRIEIIAFDFAGELEAAPIAIKAARVNRGGRPPAAFWDDMWSAIAADLYGGKLIPKTQADIERAMAGWIERHGHAADTSTIRLRARPLWDRILLLDE